MRLAIIGSRTATDYGVLCRAMDRWFAAPNRERAMEPYVVDEVVSGGAAGADTLGARWANEHGVKLTVFKPDWAKHGKAAGFIRNEDIVGAADVVLALWNGSSRGTGHSLSLAKLQRKTTLIVYIP